MAKRIQDQKPHRDAATEAWIEARLAEQEDRYRMIVREMDELAPTRARWYEDFLHIIQTRGFNYDGENRRRIPEEEVPVKPDRKDRVVF